MKASDQIAVLGIYKRVALYSQIESKPALDEQEQHGIKMARKLHWEYEVYSDLGISGLVPYGERPGLSKLVEKCILGEVTAIFVSDLDRLFRSTDHGLISLLTKHNIRLFDANGEIDLRIEEVELHLLKEKFKIT